ncbi:MAG: hypothetical protein ABSF45_26970 [Terriglobia bacterium]|jgi:hypothetical protein
MTKPFVFVSCGQFTDAEKRLGKQIVELVKTVTGLEAFFAEEVQDLNGLDSNLLGALRECTAFITVMHPRGTIVRPDGSEHVRASVWIEQEIAIATYIQRAEKRKLPVVAFIHKSVGREGIRDLLHLNPTYFTDESEVLAGLRERLLEWRGLALTGFRVQLRSGNPTYQDGHAIRQLEVILVNDTNQPITKLNAIVRLPVGILKHWSASYPTEVKSDDPRYRCFRFDEQQSRSIPPHDTGRLISFQYCTACALPGAGGIAALVAEATVDARLWIDGREYSAQKSVKELSQDAEAAGLI